MKSTDILKELGFTDEQLKSFFKGQQKVKIDITHMNRVKQDMGIAQYNTIYTPRKLVNRIKANISNDKTVTNKELVKRFDKSQTAKTLKEIEDSQRESVSNKYPIELYETFVEVAHQANQWKVFPYDRLTIENAINKYSPNYDELLNQLMEIADTFNHYEGANEYLANAEGTALNYALNMLEVLLFD